jgi:hypothetical protein
MASVIISGNTSGTVTLSAPAVAGSTTQTLVAATDTLAPIVRATQQATNTGLLTYEFTGIPSWVKKITVMINGVARSGTTVTVIQLGSTTYTTSGYLGTSWPASGGAVANSVGFGLAGNLSAGDPVYGVMTITNISGNTWVAGMCGAVSTAFLAIGGGSVTISGTLDRLRVNSLSGTATFSAGTINIMYE